MSLQGHLLQSLSQFNLLRWDLQSQTLTTATLLRTRTWPHVLVTLQPVHAHQQPHVLRANINEHFPTVAVQFLHFPTNKKNKPLDHRISNSALNRHVISQTQNQEIFLTAEDVPMLTRFLI